MNSKAPSSITYDVDSQPYLRARHGKGLCLCRLGQRSTARQVFAAMLRLNPHDSHGGAVFDA